MSAPGEDGEDPDLSPEADALRVAFAGALLGRVGLDACPPSEAVWDALHGTPTPAQRAKIVDHMATCPMCAEAWRLAVRGTPAAAERR